MGEGSPREAAGLRGWLNPVIYKYKKRRTGYRGQRLWGPNYTGDKASGNPRHGMLKV